MISLERMKRRGDYLKGKEPLIVRTNIIEELREWYEKLKHDRRKAMRDYAKNPVIYNQNGANC